MFISWLKKERYSLLIYIIVVLVLYTFPSTRLYAYILGVILVPISIGLFYELLSLLLNEKVAENILASIFMGGFVVFFIIMSGFIFKSCRANSHSTNPPLDARWVKYQEKEPPFDTTSFYSPDSVHYTSMFDRDTFQVWLKHDSKGGEYSIDVGAGISPIEGSQGPFVDFECWKVKCTENEVDKPIVKAVAISSYEYHVDGKRHSNITPRYMRDGSLITENDEREEHRLLWNLAMKYCK